MSLRSTARAEEPEGSPPPNCTLTPTPAPSPTITPATCGNCNEQVYPPQPPFAIEIPSAFQPTTRTTKLHWRIYTPTNGAPAPWPAIVDIHGGGFHSGYPFQGGPSETAQDLAAVGYYVVSVDYELAPCGVMPTQHCHDSTPEGIASGRPPEQTDDIEAIVRALRADTAHCNGRIGVLGGSTGGSHAVWVALNTVSSTGWPNWTAADQVDCAVSLSGAYDFPDRTAENYGNDPDPLPNFIRDIENYTNTGDLATQKSLSPVSLITSYDPTKFKPLFLINSQHDSMPYHQIVDMICALRTAGVPDSAYQTLTIMGSNEHSFGYWDSWDGKPGPPHTVKGDVIGFLDSHLN